MEEAWQTEHSIRSQEIQDKHFLVSSCEISELHALIYKRSCAKFQGPLGIKMDESMFLRVITAERNLWNGCFVPGTILSI